MPKYDHVLLDADGTLMDFVRGQAFALENMLTELGLPFGETVLSVYDCINAGYWVLLEQGKITKAQLAVRRFSDLLQYLKVNGNPEDMNARFLYHLGEADFLLPGAQELCASLAPHCKLTIATNGVVSTQTRRLQKSALAPYVHHLIVSEEAGAAKPEQRFFDYAFQVCGASDKSRVLMVGDSLSTDMRGGAGYGIDTCWYNPQRQKLPVDLAVTYEIQELSQLAAIVLGI